MIFKRKDKSSQATRPPALSRRAGLALMAAPFLARAQSQSGDLVVGALLSLTGGWSTLGQASQALLEQAANDMNAFLAGAGSQMRVRLRIEDTQLLPDLCVNSLRALAGAGANLIIGPQSSAEAAAILPLLNDAHVLCISQGSTASTLSLPGDNLFRWVPDDPLEAEAVVALAKAEGIYTLVPCWRADAGNRGLAVSVRQQFQDAGGIVTPGMEYAVESPAFSSVVQQLSAQVQGAAGRTAVYLAAFDEVVDLFRAATGDARLESVPWYGSDGVAFSAPLASDTVAAAFAMKTRYANPTLLRPENARDKWEPLVQAVMDAGGAEPDAFALSAYDAFWCGVTARLLAGTNDIATWKSYMAFAAENFFGATGWGRLNANGDRAYGDYDFWALRKVDGAAQWVSVAQYESNIVRVIP
jgi:branched-chain amino acid transport system substrate-binding protein